MKVTKVLHSNDYTIEFYEDKHRVTMKGTMRLPVNEYEDSINPEFISFSEKADNDIELDLTELEYLNNSGISFISMYLASMKKTGQKITIVGNRDISWQSITMDNFPLCNEEVKIVMN